MTALSIGQLTAGVAATKHARTGQPVWRNSYYEGQLEKRIWRPVADGTVKGARRYAGAVLKAARELETRSRRQRQSVQPGTRNGVLGEIGLEVLEVLYKKFVNYADGCLEPAVATIADAIGRSYAATHAALKRLRDAGFLHWIRRSKPTESPSGPQVEQITNAYALNLPKPIQRMVSWILRKPPLPEDAQWLHQQRAQEWQDMLDSLSSAEFVGTMEFVDGRVGETLSSIARMLDERESFSARETGSEIY